MIRTLKLSFGLMIMTLCVACKAQGNFPTPAVTVEVVAGVTPTATPDCLSVPGVSIELHQIDATSVGLLALELQPGEKPYVFYSAHADGFETRGEEGSFAQGADEQGSFSTKLTGLNPVDSQSRSTWDVRLVHARGVACAEITLP